MCDYHRIRERNRSCCMEPMLQVYSLRVTVGMRMPTTLLNLKKNQRSIRNAGMSPDNSRRLVSRIEKHR
jgi:hypothetical protein